MSEQPALFDVGNKWDDYWVGMPEYNIQDLSPKHTIKVHFRNDEDRLAFSKLIDQPIGEKTGFVWYPKADIGTFKDKRYKTENPIKTKYPIYIISKGRWDSRLTVKALEKIGAEYRIVVEPQEFSNYASVIHPDKILTLPFSNLGQGSIPARNWVWEHSISEGHKRHWILDDNIEGFFYFNKNLKTPVVSCSTFRAIEDFTDRYKNIDMSGMHYFMFVKRKFVIPPITFNTRIYSCILLSNKISYRWRGVYNEDTDLSIRILKSGSCTALFNVFLAYKHTTMTMKGGNTEDLYRDDGRLLMAESLQQQHPDVVTVTHKFNRWQHHVDYRPFKKNKPILKDNIEIPRGTDNYGMYLEIDEATQVA